MKLCDFTVAKILETPDEICYDCEGTPFFTSEINELIELSHNVGPEVSFCLKDGYVPRPNDIWAIGVCIYTYLTEELPFNGESDIKCRLQQKIKSIKFLIGWEKTCKISYVVFWIKIQQKGIQLKKLKHINGLYSKNCINIKIFVN